MRTNIEIDDELMAKALQAGPFKTKKEAVEAGLRLLARQSAYREILKWRGKLQWEGDDSVNWTSAPAAESARALMARELRLERRTVLVVDSSVWIDFFAGVEHPAVDQLAQLLDHGEVRIAVPDLVLFEVLRGFRHERDLRQASLLMQGLSIELCGGEDTALAAVQHCRDLRATGYTVRSGIDMLVAAFCIEKDYALLHKDRDFDALEVRRGLKVWTH